MGKRVLHDGGSFVRGLVAAAVEDEPRHQDNEDE
jgi:hypothetical protein